MSMDAINQEFEEFAAEYSPKTAKVEYEKYSDPVVYEVSLPDIHYG